jgi:hypothetical protein
MQTADGSKEACMMCGQPARVTVVGESGARSYYCMDCADKRTEGTWPMAQGILAFLPGTLIRGGALLGVLALAANYLHIAGEEGFGWKQIAGTEVGLLVVAIGAFLRRGLPTLAGALLVVVSLGADYLRIGHAPGMGWKKQGTIAFAIACVLLGLFLQRRFARRRPRAASGGA